jgi:hypothetical protein
MSLYGRTGFTVIARENPGDDKAFAAVVVTQLIFEFVCLTILPRVDNLAES